jgi:Xaa-Pro dipeptidase
LPMNRARLTKYMTESGIDAVVTWSPYNVRYLTGYWCWLAPLFKECMVSPGGSGELAQKNIAFVPMQGEPCLVLEPLWAVNAVNSWVEDVRVAGGGRLMPGEEPRGASAKMERISALVRAGEWPTGPWEVLAGVVSERGLEHGRIGVDLDGVTASDRAVLQRALPGADLLNCSNLLRLVRAQKTQEEIAAIEEAAQIAEDAASAAFKRVRAGSTLAQVSGEFRVCLGAAGADFDHFAIAPLGLGIMSDGPYELPVNEAFYLDFGCVKDGWFSDSGVTLCIGDIDAIAAEQYEAVRDAVAGAADMLRPGTLSSTVQDAMVRSLAECGISESFPHGHGLGREIRDYPLLMPANGNSIRDDCVDVPADLPLEDGMVLNLEAPVFTPGSRSVHCEQTFVVTADGYRPLGTQDRASPVLVGGTS